MEALSNYAPLILILLIFYFFIIGPQIKRSRKEKKFLGEMKNGDRIITKSGMHGKISALNDKDNSCIIETQAGKIKFERSAISIEMSEKLNSVKK